MYSKGGKNNWVLFLLLLAGVVLGGFIGYYLGQFPYFTWLNYGKDFGLEAPLKLELGILSLQFALLMRLNIAGIIGIIIGIIVYKRL